MSSGQSLPHLTFYDGVIHISGLHPAKTPSLTENDWQEILSIYTEEAFLKQIDQPVAGKYSWNSSGIYFEPTFPFSRGAIYHAVLSLEAFAKNTGVKNEWPDRNKLQLSFGIPGGEFSQASIESIYPESTIVPENLLRMYINFTGPMMTGEAYDHIKLIDEKGKQIDKAFLIIDQELWDKERKRFTILFDPGRIKRGLKANLELGPPLKEGEKYYLVIDSTWRDVNGNYLKSSYKKSIAVTSAHRTKLSIQNLKTNVPGAGSREPLVMSFDRPIDHVLVSKYITIRSGSSGMMNGQFVLNGDTTLTFMPDHMWKQGSYTVEISPLLEDVAGNNFNNAFDLDLSSDSRVSSTELIKIKITIKPVIP